MVQCLRALYTVRGNQAWPHVQCIILQTQMSIDSYSREPESITELRRQNERLHIDAEKAAALYSGARVTVPKMSNKSNGYIQREF